MKLWTAWLDYFATGEGRTMCALIMYSQTEEEVREKFRSLFGSWFAQGMEVSEGLVKNEVVTFIFTDRALLTANAAASTCGVHLHGQIHFNFS